MVQLDLPVFPPEIFDRIIEFCQDDHQVLATTSLVCSEWLPASRRYLFRTIIIRPSTLKEFSVLCGSGRSTFFHHICDIRLEDDLIHKIGEINLNDSPTPTQSALINEELLSWFPHLPSVSTIAFLDEMRWDSLDSLVRFGSLLPNVDTVSLITDKVEKANDIFRAFPYLRILFFPGVIHSQSRYHSTALIELPQSASDTVLPSRLETLRFFDTRNRDDFICRVPFGSIQLKRFHCRISTAESPRSLQNLILFIKHHCLDVSDLRLEVKIAHIPPKPQRDAQFNSVFKEFIVLFSQFRQLHWLTMIIIYDDVNDKKLPEWVYESLDRLNPDLDIWDLQLCLWIPPTELESVNAEIGLGWDQDKFFDRHRIGPIFLHEKFRRMRTVPVWLYSQQMDTGVLWVKFVLHEG